MLQRCRNLCLALLDGCAAPNSWASSRRSTVHQGSASKSLRLHSFLPPDQEPHQTPRIDQHSKYTQAHRMYVSTSEFHLHCETPLFQDWASDPSSATISM